LNPNLSVGQVFPSCPDKTVEFKPNGSIKLSDVALGSTVSLRYPSSM
jgi:hypothetical protein